MHIRPAVLLQGPPLALQITRCAQAVIPMGLPGWQQAMHQDTCMALMMVLACTPRRASHTTRSGCATTGATAMRTPRSARSRSRSLPLTTQGLRPRRRMPACLEG